MPRKKQTHTLNVYLHTELVGKLEKAPNGAIQFEYAKEWIEKGYAISLSLPLSKKAFKGAEVSFYFDNLLPDNEKIRDAIAQKFKAESTSQFDLLYAIGRECVGALSFFDENITPDFSKKILVKILTNEQIAKKIQGLSTDNPLGMDDGDFRLSLGGAQEKMALLKRKEKWGEPRGMTPTTHIFKKRMNMLAGKIDFALSVDNEHTCLRLAGHFGINVCKSSIETFLDERILCLERFDRYWKDNVLHRIPQEDFCQASGQSPKLKYERDGGPGIKAMMKMLENSNNAKDDKKMFIKTCLFNELIYNTDAHAKNFSLYIVRAGYVLTPMYDLLSAHFIVSQNQERYDSMRGSLSVNGKFKFNDITLEDWLAECEQCRFPKEAFDEILKEVGESMAKLDAFEEKIKDEVNHAHLKLILDGVKRRWSVYER